MFEHLANIRVWSSMIPKIQTSCHQFDSWWPHVYKSRTVLHKGFQWLWSFKANCQAFLPRHIWVNLNYQSFGEQPSAQQSESPRDNSFITELLKLYCAYDSPGISSKCSGPRWGLRFCISNKLPGDANALGPWTAPLRSKSLQQTARATSVFLGHKHILEVLNRTKTCSSVTCPAKHILRQKV